MSEIVTIRDVSYKYDRTDDRWALDGVSCTIKKGEWVSIIGSNGSGKSTLAKTLNGLIEPQKGDVTIAGLALTIDNVWDIRKRVGMVFQHPDNQFVGATVQDDVAFGLENIGVPREDMLSRIEESLKQVGMSGYEDREPARLSGGQKQRVAIAGIIALQPEVMILDEATSMLDPKGRESVLTTVKQIKQQKGLTVLSITHDIDEALASDRVIVMKNGKIVQQGTPDAVFSQTDQLSRYGLGIPFAENLKQALMHRHIEVPQQYMTEEGMMEWLWTSISKM